MELNLEAIQWGNLWLTVSNTSFINNATVLVSTSISSILQVRLTPHSVCSRSIFYYQVSWSCRCCVCDSMSVKSAPRRKNKRANADGMKEAAGRGKRRWRSIGWNALGRFFSEVVNVSRSPFIFTSELSAPLAWISPAVSTQNGLLMDVCGAMTSLSRLCFERSGDSRSSTRSLEKAVPLLTAAGVRSVALWERGSKNNNPGFALKL